MRVAVGISGGIDSAVAAYVLKASGADVIGVTMTLGRADEAQSLSEASSVAAALGIPFEVCDLASLWKEQVLEYIRETYLIGQTPNPCVRCNEYVKFSALPRYAFETLGCDQFATGHYARLKDGRLFRGLDRTKDQSYFLYRIPKDVRDRTRFPLGDMTKCDVRRLWASVAPSLPFIPASLSIDGSARGARESQDFCGGDTQAIVARSDVEGDVVRTDGTVIGRHRGYWHYTIGQRKGLGIGGGTPFYVVRLDCVHNRVVVGTRDEAFGTTLVLSDTLGEIDLSLPVKVRSTGEPRRLADGILGIAPGQSAVFYRADEVVGGGIIVGT